MRRRPHRLRVALAIAALCHASGLVLSACELGGDERAGDKPRAESREQDPRVALERSRDRAHPEDARAKARARALVEEMEACYRRGADYLVCVGATELARKPAAYGRGPGQVAAVAVTVDSFSAVAVSLERSGGKQHTFTATRDPSGRELRTCRAGPANDSGACIGGAWGFAYPVRPARTGASLRRRRDLRETDRAQAKALSLAEAMQRCFERTHDYVLCQTPSDLGVPKADYGSSAGQAQVVATTPQEFSIVSHSRTGTHFSLRQIATGVPERACEPVGATGCSADGRW